MEPSDKKRTGASAFGEWSKDDFTSFHRAIRSPLAGWLFFLCGCFLITLLLSFQIESLPTNARVGSVAPKDIKADQNYEIIDEKSTQKNREEALKSVLPVYDLDEALGAEVERQLQEGFSKVRALLATSPDATLDPIRDAFETGAGIRISDEPLKFLAAEKFSWELESLLRSFLKTLYSEMIVDEPTSLRKYVDTGVNVRRIRIQEPENETIEKNFESLKGVDEVRSELPARFKTALHNLPLKGANPEALAALLSRVLRPNLSYNLAETELRRAKAVATVKPVIVKIQAGESIIRSGDRYEPWHLVVLKGIQRQKSSTNFAVKFIGTFFFVALLILVTYAFAARYIKKFHTRPIDLMFLGVNLIAILIFVRLFAAVASAFRDSIPFEIEMQTLYYAIPVSAGAMLVRLVLNSEVAIVFAVIASAMAGLFLRTDVDLSIYFLISSIAAAGSIAHADRRSAILKAGFFTGLINAMTIFTIKMVQVVSITQSWATVDIVTNLLSGFLGGTNSALFVLFYMPIVEMIFGYTTDIKLLELGNLNHPLLKQMIVKAPGTYHHSQLVAVLAEAAAESVGANPIFARVGAYFHDVGKMKKPLYFIENQMGGENRHNNLSPSMSALIIASHVKDGIDLAEEHKLPKVIIDMIPQHQGTKLMTFFYNKAKEAEKSDLHVVKEEDYRYPGPRPQSREAGILLLADGVEAAVRSIPEKTPAKIQAMVQKIINKSFSEEQLEECDLTLKDLRKIADSFVRVLIGIYHQRIEYPETQEKKTSNLPIKLEVVTAPPTGGPLKLGEEESHGENDSQKPTVELKSSSTESSRNGLNYPHRTGRS